MEDCIFCKIAKGQAKSWKVYENDYVYAFFDIGIFNEYHTLVIPKKEINKIFDLDKETYAGLMDFSYRVAKALEKTVSCERIGMSVIGLEVPHVHVHLLPINKMADMQFVEKEKMTNEEFTVLAKEISRNFI